MYFLVSGAINFLTSLGLTIFVSFYGPKRELKKAFSAFTGSIAIWAFGYTLWQFYQHIVPDPEKALFWIRFAMVGSMVIPVTFTEFVIRFVEREKEFRTIRLLNILACVVLLAFSYSSWFIKGLFPILVFRFWPDPGPLLHVQLTLFAMNVLLGYMLMLKKIRISTGVTKRRIEFIFLGSLAGFTGGGMNYLPWYHIPILPLGNIAVSFYIIFSTYAIIQYRLLDIRVAISYLVIFAVVFGLIFFLPLFLLFPPEDRLRTALWGVAVSVAFLIYRYFQKKAEATLVKEERLYLKALEAAAQEMPLIKDVDHLIETIVTSFVNNIRISDASLYLKNQEGYFLGYAFGDGKESFPQEIATDDPIIGELLNQGEPILGEEVQDQPAVSQRFSQMKASVAIPCFIKEEMLGFLVLGEKKSGKAYNPEDLKAFQGLTVPLALAIENAGYLKQLESLHVQALEAAKFRAIRQMINAMGHEMGNLLTPVVGKAQMMLMMRKEKLDEELTQVFREISNRGLASGEIIREIKDYYDRSKKKEMIEFEIRQTIEQGLERLKKNFAEIGVVAEKKVNGDLGKIQANKSFGDLFYHLLKNSYYNLKKYQQSDLRISAKRNGKYAEVVIEDAGGSFDRHIQDDTSGGELFTERGSLGGVNLYLAKAIAQDHGVELKVGSLGDTGGQFIVRIPYV